MKRPVSEAETSFGVVQVFHTEDHMLRGVRVWSLYEVCVDGKVKHPNCKAEDVMRVLTHYLQGK